jgi:hypothetical protein
MSNFTLLNLSLPDVARLLIAMVQARDAVESRSWSHPQEPRTPKRRSSDMATIERTFYRLADEPHEVILVACSLPTRRVDCLAWVGLSDAEPA